MTKHIGIVGCSAEGAALCYRTICLEAEPLMGKHAASRNYDAHDPAGRVYEAN